MKVALRERSCKIYDSDLRIKIGPSIYTYPDASVVLGEALFENARRDSLLNPTVFIEVLSPSTEKYDRGKKFQHYQTLLTIRDYILIAQDAHRVEHYLRQRDNTWLMTVYEGLEASLNLTSLYCTLLSLADIYEGVTLES
ncbi:MAG: Uma2 family endonuclease [Trueperaceae bacterium]